MNFSTVEDQDWYKEATPEQKRIGFQTWIPKKREEIRSLISSGVYSEEAMDQFNKSVEEKYLSDFGSEFFSKENAKDVAWSVHDLVGTLAKGASQSRGTYAYTEEQREKAEKRFEAQLDIYQIKAEKMWEGFKRGVLRYGERDDVDNLFNQALDVFTNEKLTKEERSKKLSFIQDQYYKEISELHADADEEAYKLDPKKSFTDKENLLLIRAYTKTRDPFIKDALNRRMTIGLNQEKMEKDLEDAYARYEPDIGKMPDGIRKESAKRIMEYSTSLDEFALDLGLTILGGASHKLVSKVGGKLMPKKTPKIPSLLGRVAALGSQGVGEVGTELLTAYLDDPFLSPSEIDRIATASFSSGVAMQAPAQIGGAVQDVKGIISKGKKTEITGDSDTAKEYLDKELTEDQQVSRNTVESKVKEIENEFDEEIQLVDTLDDMEDGFTKTEAKKAEAEGDNIEAFVDPTTNKVVYNISGIQKQAENLGITIDERMDQLANHEIVTHKGIKTLYSDATEFSNFHEQIYNSFESEIQQNIQPNYTNYDASTEQGRIGLAQEFLANMAENTDMDSSLWDNLVQSFSEFYKTKINKNYTGLTKAELRNTLRTSYRGLKDKADQKKAEAEKQRVENNLPHPESEQGVVSQLNETRLRVPEQNPKYIQDEKGKKKGKLIERLKKEGDPETSKIANQLEQQNRYENKSREESIEQGTETWQRLVKDSGDDIDVAVRDGIKEIERPDFLGIFGDNMDAAVGFMMAMYEALEAKKKGLAIDPYKVKKIEAQQRRIMEAASIRARAPGRFISALSMWTGLNQKSHVSKIIQKGLNQKVTEQVDRDLLKDVSRSDAKENNETADKMVDDIISELLPEDVDESIATTVEGLDIAKTEQTEMDLFAQEKEQKEKAAEKLTIRQAVKEEGGIKPPSEKAGGEYDGYYTGDKNKDGSRKKKQFGKGVISTKGLPVDTLIQTLSSKYPQLGLEGDIGKFWEMMDDNTEILSESEFEEQKFLESTDLSTVPNKELEGYAMGTDAFAERAKSELMEREENGEYIEAEGEQEAEYTPDEDVPFSKQGDIQFSKQAGPKKIVKGLTPSEAKTVTKNIRGFIGELKKALQNQPDELDTYKKVAMKEMGLSAKGTDRFAKNYYAYRKSQIKQAQKAVKKAKAQDPKESSIIKLVREFAGGLDPQTKKVLDPILQNLVSNVRKAMNESIKGLREQKGIDTKQKKKTDTEILADALKNYSEYKDLWTEFEKTMEEKYKNNPQKLAEFEEIFDSVADLKLSDRIFRGVLREKAKQIGKKLSEVVREAKENSSSEISFRDALIAEAIDQMGLTPSEAKVFADRFNRIFAEEASKARANARKIIIDRHNKSVGNKSKLGKEKLSVIEKMTEYDNLNVFSEEASYNAVAESLGLPSYTPEIAQKIQGFLDKIQSFEKNSVQQRDAIIELEQYIADTIGIDAVELSYSIYLSAMLAGYSTQIVNATSGIMNLLVSTPTIGIAEARKQGVGKRHIPHLVFVGYLEFIKQLLNPKSASYIKAKRAISKGVVTDAYKENILDPKALDTARLGGQIKLRNDNFLNMIISAPYRIPYFGKLFEINKFTTRLLIGSDAFIREMAYQQKTQVAAAVITQKNGGSYMKNYKKAIELMYRTPEQIEQARKEAIAEGATPDQVKARALEIIRKKIIADIGSDIVDSGDYYSGRISFNEPTRATVMGMSARFITNGFSMLSKSEESTALKATAFMGKALLFPFVNIVANVVDRSIDLEPTLSGVRYASDRIWLPDYKGSEADYQQRADMMLGGFALMLVGVLAFSESDDGEPILRVYNELGDGDDDARDMALEAGELEYSFDLNLFGKRTSRIVYKDLPLSRILGLIGVIQGKQRKGEPIDWDALGQWMYMNWTMTTSMSFISSFESFASLISTRNNEEQFIKKLGKLFGGAPARLIWPGQNFFLQLDRGITEETSENKTIKENFLRNFPVLRHYTNKPMLNVFGEEIKKYVPSARAWNYLISVDDKSKFFVENGLDIPRYKNQYHLQHKDIDEPIDMSPAEAYEHHKRSSREYTKVLMGFLPDAVERISTPEEREALQKEIDEVVSDFRAKVRWEMQKEIDEGKSFD